MYYSIIKDKIKQISGCEIQNDDDKLFDIPYNLTVYDMVYTICDIFNQLGFSDIKITKNVLMRTKFDTVIDINNFLKAVIDN